MTTTRSSLYAGAVFVDGFNRAGRQKIRQRLAALSLRRLPDDGGRAAAVLVPLCTQEGAPSILFTKRSDRVGTHKGQVSFPGGMRDADDASFADTALREVEEELGIVRSEVELLGRFHEATAITGVRVVPFIGYLGQFEALDLAVNDDEIDHVFCLSLRDLVAPEKRYLQSFESQRKFQVFDAGPYPVWGLTAYMLEEVLTEVFGLVLAPPTG